VIKFPTARAADGPGAYTQLIDLVEDDQATEVLYAENSDTAPLPDVEWETADTARPIPEALRRNPMIIVIAALSALILLILGSMVTWLVMSSQPTPIVDPVTITMTETTTVTTTVTATPPPPATTEQDYDLDARLSLEDQLQADAGTVRSNLEGRWTTQLSAKRNGLVSDGMTWTHQDIWNDFTTLKDFFPSALLVQASSYRSFNLGSEWYVTVSGLTFYNANAALDWCKAQGRNDDECFAIRITNDRGNNTKHQHR